MALERGETATVRPLQDEYTPGLDLRASARRVKRSHEKIVFNSDGRDAEQVPLESHYPDPQPLGCKCRNSRCLKLYCVCFAAGTFCDGCSCVDCGNTEENISEVQKRRHKVNVKNPHAFQDKKNPVVAKGCNCLKSRCLKGYCECFAAGRGCMAICCCKDCKNVHGIRPVIDEHLAVPICANLLSYGARDGDETSDSQKMNNNPITRITVPSKKRPIHCSSTSADSSEHPRLTITGLSLETGGASQKRTSGSEESGGKAQDVGAAAAMSTILPKDQHTVQGLQQFQARQEENGPNKAANIHQGGKEPRVAVATLFGQALNNSTEMKTQVAKDLKEALFDSLVASENSRPTGNELPIQNVSATLLSSPDDLQLTVVSAPSSADRSTDSPEKHRKGVPAAAVPAATNGPVQEHTAQPLASASPRQGWGTCVDPLPLSLLSPIACPRPLVLPKDRSPPQNRDDNPNKHQETHTQRMFSCNPAQRPAMSENPQGILISQVLQAADKDNTTLLYTAVPINSSTGKGAGEESTLFIPCTEAPRDKDKLQQPLFQLQTVDLGSHMATLACNTSAQLGFGTRAAQPTDPAPDGLLERKFKSERLQKRALQEQDAQPCDQVEFLQPERKRKAARQTQHDCFLSHLLGARFKVPRRPRTGTSDRTHAEDVAEILLSLRNAT